MRASEISTENFFSMQEELDEINSKLFDLETNLEECESNVDSSSLSDEINSFNTKLDDLDFFIKAMAIAISTESKILFNEKGIIEIEAKDEETGKKMFSMCELSGMDLSKITLQGKKNSTTG